MGSEAGTPSPVKKIPPYSNPFNSAPRVPGSPTNPAASTTALLNLKAPIDSNPNLNSPRSKPPLSSPSKAEAVPAIPLLPVRPLESSKPHPNSLNPNSTTNSTKPSSRSAPAAAPPPKSLLRRLAGPSDQKAGQTFRDPAEVSAIILKHSIGSAFYDNEVRKDKELTAKVDRLLVSLAAEIQKKKSNLKEEELKVDKLLIELEKERELGEIIIVVDCDAFYASCAELKDESLKGTAFAVGEGVLTTASYEARKYGCRSAMPGFIAKQLCPHLTFVELDFPWYSECSKKIMKILAEYGPCSPASLDEAYVSITEYCKNEDSSAGEVVQGIRERIKEETGLTVSAGISPNASISKIAADFRKPNGQFEVASTKEACMEFMGALACRKVSGIGRVGERWLSGLGIEIISDIFKERGKLYLVRKEIGLTSLLRRYLGLGTTKIEVSQRRDRKSCGFERTFQAISKPNEMYDQLSRAAKSLEEDITKLQYSGRTVNLTFKLSTYERGTRSITRDSNSEEFMFKQAKGLLDQVIRERQRDFDNGKAVVGCGGNRDLSVRLLGIRMTNLRDDTLEKGGLDKWTVKKPVEKKEYLENLELPVEKEPSSSDEMWALFPDFEEIDKPVTDLNEASPPPVEKKEERFKPFFTAGPSIDSKVEPKGGKIHSVAAKKDQLSFKAPIELECPICEVIFQSSEIGMSSHVDQCLKRMEQESKKEEKAKAKGKGKKRASESELASKKKKGAFFK